MHVDHSQARYREDRIGEDSSVRRDDAKVGIERSERHDEALVTHLVGLEHQNLVLERRDLRRSGTELSAATSWTVRLTDHTDHEVP